MTKTTDTKMTYDGHYYRDDKEQVYFTVESTLSRVGTIKAKFIAERSKYTSWGEWRIMRSTMPEKSGVGPVALRALGDVADAEITAWLESNAYDDSIQKAIARFIADSVNDTRFGTNHAKGLLEQYRARITDADAIALDAALSHLDRVQALLDEVNGVTR